MATLIDAPAFTADEVYEIQATDAVEGAAAGASFGGIGLSNQPHQQLANRTAFLKQRQDTNITNIGALLAFMGKFTGSLQTNGYLEIPIADINRGSVIAVIQWGFYQYNANIGGGDTEITLTWPVPFPNLCLWANATPARNPSKTAPDLNEWVPEIVQFTAANASIELNNIPVGQSSTYVYGFYWLAIGF